MGKTAFSGPVFGSKSLLMTTYLSAVSTGAGDGISTVIGAGIVPIGEDWYATDFFASRESTGSTSYGLAVDANGSNVSSAVFTSSNAAQRINVTVTADGGEFMGKRIPGGSTVTFRLVVSSGIGASSGVTCALYGFPRYVSSSRYAE